MLQQSYKHLSGKKFDMARIPSSLSKKTDQVTKAIVIDKNKQYSRAGVLNVGIIWPCRNR